MKNFIFGEKTVVKAQYFTNPGSFTKKSPLVLAWEIVVVITWTLEYYFLGI